MATTIVVAPDLLVTLDGVTRTAWEWAVVRKLKWNTVRNRRYRGKNWREALAPKVKGDARSLGSTWKAKRPAVLLA